MLKSTPDATPSQKYTLCLFQFGKKKKKESFYILIKHLTVAYFKPLQNQPLKLKEYEQEEHFINSVLCVISLNC